MNPRTQNILTAVIREFIDTGDPVSSGFLFDNYEFGIKPAMIRAEMNMLTEEGLLHQPHHSAGRVPTDRGYEFFASLALDEESEETQMFRELASSFINHEWHKLLHSMSHTLGMLGAIREVGRHDVYKEGLEHLVEHLTWETPSEIKSVIHDFEALDERLVESEQMFAGSGNDFLQIFVGRKSPVTKSPMLSVIAGNYEVDGRRIVVVGIGPKRMDYEKSAKVFRGLKQATKP